MLFFANLDFVSRIFVASDDVDDNVDVLRVFWIGVVVVDRRLTGVVVEVDRLLPDDLIDDEDDGRPSCSSLLPVPLYASGGSSPSPNPPPSS